MIKQHLIQLIGDNLLYFADLAFRPGATLSLHNAPLLRSPTSRGPLDHIAIPALIISGKR